jgi:hypothetical protein
MTQSSPLNPKDAPLKGQTTQDLKLALRGLNYDLDTELENFRRWRQQAQKSSNAQAPGLVTLPTEVSRAYRRMQSSQTKYGYGRSDRSKGKLSLPNFNLSAITASVTPVTLAAGAIILLSLGSILMLFTNRGDKGESTTAATTTPVQSASPSKSGSVILSPSEAQPPRTATPLAPPLAVAPTKIQPKPPIQSQPSKTKATQPSKPVAAQKSAKAIGPSAFSTFKGYGYYYVFVPIDGNKDLGKLKAMTSGAYPRVIDGRTYMQMAAYDSDRRAQILAGQLRQKGYTVAVKK